MKKVLFVTYGGGHVKMVVPVAKALASLGLAKPVVLALTAAAPVVRDAGLEMLQFKDFITPADSFALQQGRGLCLEMQSPVIDEDETIAYLGLSFADLVAAKGEVGAHAAYARMGRQAFLPVPTLNRILRSYAPDLVIVTNSPRAEQAAAIAARQLGIPVICLIDLFAIDEVRWIGAPDYADHLCVLNESVKHFLVKAGRSSDEITVTGNPGFDALFSTDVPVHAAMLRSQMHWQHKRVILWPSVVEPDVHPFHGGPGNPDLPARVLNALIRWVQMRHDCVLCIRPRPSENEILGVVLPTDNRIVLTGQGWPLAPLLQATDLVVMINSTVGLEGRLVGARVIQVLGSVLDAALPLDSYGMADETIEAEMLESALERQVLAPRHPVLAQFSATANVVDVISGYL